MRHKPRRAHKHPYHHDGRDYMIGDSVIVLYVKKVNVKGFVTEANKFNSSSTSYKIHKSSFAYPT